jgi:hypothetical protein
MGVGESITQSSRPFGLLGTLSQLLLTPLLNSPLLQGRLLLPANKLIHVVLA